MDKLYLSYEVARKYHNKAVKISDNAEDIGIRRALRMELQNIYGLTELEAINVLNGRNVSDYVRKYQNIKNNMTPKPPKEMVSDAFEGERANVIWEREDLLEVSDFFKQMEKLSRKQDALLMKKKMAEETDGWD